MITPSSRGVYRFGEFELNLDLRVLARSGQRVLIGPKAYEILVCLVSNAGSAVSKTDLLKAVWPEAHVGEGTLTQHVFSLRKALGDRATSIVTVPGFGYRFAEAVRHEKRREATTEPQTSAGSIVHELRERTHVVIEEPMVPAPAAPRRTHLYTVLASAFVLAAVLILGGWRWRRHNSAPDHVGVVLADFSNATGDTAFDKTLGRAMDIDLSQSTFLDVMSERDSIDVLRMMGQKPDAVLTPSIAREVCERANRQVFLSGALANVGSQYLVTLDAVDCATGKTLAAAKADAADKSKVLDAMESVAGTVRSKLGESARSITRNDVPLAQAATSSLEALKDYSLAQSLSDQGVSQDETLPLYERAVELDPKFALAYEAMAGNYYERQEGLKAAENYKKAFDLRDRVNENDRLGFEARYYAYGIGDAVKGLEAFRVWAARYPRDFRPWINIANFDNQLGNSAEAIAAGGHAIQLNPNYGRAYAITARALKNSSRFSDAKAVLAEGIRRGVVGRGDNTSFEIAVYEHNGANLAFEIKAAEDQQRQLRNYYLGQARSMQGKYVEAMRLLELEIDEDRKQGKGDIVDGVLVEMASIARQVGYADQAKKYLARVSPGYRSNDDAALEFALNGNLTYAKSFLAEHANDMHAPTDQAAIAFPQLRAAIFLEEHKPKEALASLEPSRPYLMAGLVTRSERAAAYGMLPDSQKAADDYRNVVNTPGSGFGILFPLAKLGLARSEAAVGNVTASRAAYEGFLNDWKDADPDLPVLKAAKVELAQLH